MKTPQERDSSQFTKDPRHHAANIRNSLDELIGHLRQDISIMEEQKAQALFETAAEVLTGLRTAFDHYERKTERAMIEGDAGTPDYAPGDPSERSPSQENL